MALELISKPAGISPIPEYVNVVHLSGAAKNANLGISGEYQVGLLSINGSGIWLRANGTAVAPTGDITDGTGSMWVPPDTLTWFRIDGNLSSVSMLTASGTNIVTIGLFKKRND